MNWTRLHAYCWQSDEGYRIAAVRVGERIFYSAFAPPVAYEIFKNMGQVHYKRGERIPQQRELLGTFEDSGVAREACARYVQPQAVMA